MYAYVKIALDSANETDIYEALKGMPEVKEVHILFGEWDVIAKLELPVPQAKPICQGPLSQPGLGPPSQVHRRHGQCR